MVNQQLLDYIKQQLQAGVASDAIRKSLTDAGWQSADIEDSMKAAQPAASPVASAMSAGGNAAEPFQKSDSEKIDPVVAMGGTASPSSSKDKFLSGSSGNSMKAAVETQEEEADADVKKFVIGMIAMGAVIVLLAGSLAFVYFNLSGQLETAKNGAMMGDSGQSGDLQSQVSQLTDEKETLTTQLTQANAQREEIENELGFFVVSPEASTSTPVFVVVRGSLSGNASTSFALTTTNNVRVLVANSSDPQVVAALSPLTESTTTVELGGNHLPASANLTVTSVNGAPL